MKIYITLKVLPPYVIKMTWCHAILMTPMNCSVYVNPSSWHNTQAPVKVTLVPSRNCSRTLQCLGKIQYYYWEIKMKLTSFCTINSTANISFVSSHCKDPGNLFLRLCLWHYTHNVRYSHLKFLHLILNPINKSEEGSRKVNREDIMADPAIILNRGHR